VLWGTLFLDESIHVSTVAGGAVILFSVWLITRTPTATEQTRVPAPFAVSPSTDRG
jgi:drug/metabolite transporter (DMT)-like permease